MILNLPSITVTETNDGNGDYHIHAVATNKPKPKKHPSGFELPPAFYTDDICGEEQ